MKRIFRILVLLAMATATASAADTVAGCPDEPGQTQKVAVVEGPVLLRASDNVAVRDAYAGEAGELTFAAEEPYDWRLHTGDGRSGGYSLFLDYILPLWRNRWISWEENVASAPAPLRMNGHAVRLSSRFSVRGDSSAVWFLAGGDVLAYLWPAGAGETGGAILDWSVSDGTCTVTVADADDGNDPVLQVSGDLSDDDSWADAEGVSTNRLDGATVQLTYAATNSPVFLRVAWPATTAAGVHVFGDVSADSLTVGGVTIRSWGEVRPDLADYATLEAATNIAAAAVAGYHATNGLASTNWVTEYVAEHGGGGVSPGGWGEAWYTTNDIAMTENGNLFAAFALDCTSTNVTLFLAPQTNFQTVVVRKISALHEAYVVGETTNTLTYDGQTLLLDWWPQLTNWYWRTY